MTDKTAVQNEAEGVEEVSVSWRDLTFTFPADTDDWPVEALEAFEQGKAATAIRALAGPKAWVEFKKRNPRVRDMSDVFKDFARAAGFSDAGE